MKKKNIIIIIITILLIMLNISIYVFREVNFDTGDFKLGMKSLLRQELTLEEMKNSSLYKAYEQINYNSDTEEVNNIIKKDNKNYAGSFESWDLVYGRILIMPSKADGQKVLNKLVSFNTPSTVKLTDDELNSLFECKTLDEVTNILGESIMKAESFDENGELNSSTYEWGIKARYFKHDQYGGFLNFPSPFKQKFRVNVDVAESNIVHKLYIERY